MAYPTSDAYKLAVRNGAGLTYTIDALYNGSPVSGATGLQVTSGTIVDTVKAGPRRTLTTELAPPVGQTTQWLYNTLAPIGTRLKATAHVTLTDRSTVDVPMGLFEVDSQTISENDGKLSFTAPDKWQRIVRARFLWPTGPQVGIKVTDQIVALIRDALGSSEPVTVTATSTATVGSLTWQQDRAQAIIDLAASIGAWVYFDRNGTATVADIPTTGKSADWLIDASKSGVLVTLDRSRDRSRTFNVVVVNSTAASGEKYPVQYVWDSDPNSPTYAGTNPQFATNAGPFGIVPYFHDDPILTTAAQAQAAGLAILSQTVGLASAVSLTAAHNPAIDAFDALDVLPPQQRSDVARVIERHMVDTVTHQLDVQQAQQIAARSTRTDPYS